MRVVDLGLVGFQGALDIQMAAVEAVRAGGEERLLLLEHTPVVTFGRHGGEENLLLPPEVLRSRGIEVVKTSRGGNITCHFPGQVVAYPILRLAGRPGGLHGYFFDLEQVIIDALAFFGLPGERSPGRPGVWSGRRKVASLGIGVKRWVSYHGLALNVLADLSLFQRITACGLPDVEMTSMALELARRGLDPGAADIPGVKRALVQAFHARFPVDSARSPGILQTEGTDGGTGGSSGTGNARVA